MKHANDNNGRFKLIVSRGGIVGVLYFETYKARSDRIRKLEPGTQIYSSEER